jgi:hypothetical protein
MIPNDLDRRFSALPVPDVAAAAAARILRRGQAVLARERLLAAHPRRAAAIRAWDSVLEPALATGAVAVYLGWMVLTVRPLLPM